MSRRRFLALGAAGVAGLALAACGDDGGSDSAIDAADDATGGSTTLAKSTEKDFGGKTITTAVYAKNHASSPLLWQQFAPPGLTVMPVIFTSAGDISRALANGELDFGLMGPYNTLIEASTTGMKSRIICMCSRQGFGLIARKDKGITSPADLAGKKVAVPPPGAQVLVLGLLLEQAGLTLGTDVEGVPLGYADHVAALTSGQVDAFMGSEPPCSQAVAEGTGVRLPGVFDTALGDLNTALWASGAVLEDPELVT
ncbi:MAG: ABC transporter substrate-binding protein, partial [Actinomycetota bacterium]|nr:ABC transporter substrate-binding protein [Actinomycetota bacterium]